MTRPFRRWPTAVILVAALGLLLFRIAESARFDWFAFFDPGADLAEHALMARGLRPTIDFGYIYGLLPLGMGEIWYGLFGLTPSAFLAASIVCGMLVVWGIGRILETIGAGVPAVLLVVAALPLNVVQTALPSLAHAIEPAILAHGLADLTQGRRRRALAMAALCVFVKPSMAYVFGLIVLVAIVKRDRPRSLRDWLRAIGPALATGLISAMVLGVWFGGIPLMNTLLPFRGRAVYQANRFGFFFGVGRPFWLPDRPRWSDYFGTVTGPWIAGTIVLSIASIKRIMQRSQQVEDEGRSDLILACGAMHGAFVLFFFGNRWSWFYYMFVLVIGLAVTVTNRGLRGSIVAGLLILLMIAPGLSALRGASDAWRNRTRSPETFGLWASPTVIDEWKSVLALTKGKLPALLATTEGAAVLDRGFAPPEVSFLVRGHFRPEEMARKVSQVEAALMVIVDNPEPGAPWFDTWPEFKSALRRHKIVWSCARLRVYERER